MRTLPQLFPFGIAAALAACSVDAITFAQGEEDCASAGDEDGNGLADCADPACAAERSCGPGCGNGKPDPGEGCDDGNDANGDGCDNNCTVTGCRNGVATAAELCDDGNDINGDGCDNNCTTTRCGNGVKAPSEGCDDGNLVNGDGCESTCQITGSGSYEAIADAMIRTSTTITDASTNYGTQPGLFTYGSSFGTVARSLIAFDLTAVPPGSPIRSAHLSVRMVDQAGIDFSIGVHETMGPWLETGVTWNNQPPISPTEASLGFQGYTWWRFDVTALVQRWVSAPIAKGSVTLIQEPESFASGGEYARFDSREGMNRPHLEIIVGP